MQAGLAAAVALDPARSCEDNAAAMGEALAHVRTGSVTGAARDDAAEATPRFLAGDAVGFVEEELVAWGDVEETLEAVLAELSREAELVTLIEGDGRAAGGRAGRRAGPRRGRARVRARRPARLLVAHRRRVASSATATASTSVRIAVGAGTNASTAPTRSAIDGPRDSTPARIVATAKHAQPIEKAR